MRFKESPFYKWYLLIVATLIQILAVSIAWNSLPVLFTEIAQDLNLSIVQIGIIWSMPLLSIVIFALPSGLIGNKLGIRQVISIGCILAAVMGGLRGISGNFVELTVFTFLFGASFTAIYVNIVKVTKMWFPRHELGVSNGIILAGIGIGAGLGAAVSGVILSPLLGGWRNVLFLYAALTVVLAIIWWQSVKGFTLNLELDDNVNTAESDMSFQEILSRVVRSKNLWLFAVSYCGLVGSFLGMLHYLPIYLETSGMPKVSAHGIVSSLSWAGVAGMIVLPAISDKISSRKSVLLPSVIIGCIYVLLLPRLSGGALWAVAIIGGFALPGCVPLLFAGLLEVKDIKLAYSGTALGLMLSIGHFGGFASVIIGDILATGNPILPFTFWASLPILSIAYFLFIRETRHEAARG